MATAFPTVAAVGRMSLGAQITLLNDLDRKREYWMGEQDRCDRVGDGFNRYRADQKLDDINARITAAERDLRDRFAGVDLMALAQRIS